MREVLYPRCRPWDRESRGSRPDGDQMRSARNYQAIVSKPATGLHSNSSNGVHKAPHKRIRKALQPRALTPIAPALTIATLCKYGSVRVIYTAQLASGVLLALLIYGKGATENIPAHILRKIAKEFNHAPD